VQIAVAPLPQASGSEAEQAQPVDVQDWPAGHTFPQAKQLFASLVSVAQ